MVEVMNQITKKKTETTGLIVLTRHVFLKDGSKGHILYMHVPLTLMTGLQVITKEIYADRLKNKLTLVRCEVSKGVKDSKNGKNRRKIELILIVFCRSKHSWQCAPHMWFLST